MSATKYGGEPQGSTPLQEALTTDKRYQYGVPVDLFIEYFGVNNPEVLVALRQSPTLCYLLGSVTKTPQTEDGRPDNTMRPVYFLTEGSSMFALKNKDDAMRWRGMFNHITGTSRQVYYLALRLQNLSPEQKQQFGHLGFDSDSFENIDPELLKSFMLISHSARRQADEKVWHGLNDSTHQDADPGIATINYLKKNEGFSSFYRSNEN